MSPLIPTAAPEDLDRSDAVVVCSEFAQDSFVRAGWRPEHVHVAYLGIDYNFFGAGQMPTPGRRLRAGPSPSSTHPFSRAERAPRP